MIAYGLDQINGWIPFPHRDRLLPEARYLAVYFLTCYFFINTIHGGNFVMRRLSRTMRLGLLFFFLFIAVPWIITGYPYFHEIYCRSESRAVPILFLGWLIMVSMTAHFWLLSATTGKDMRMLLVPVLILHGAVVIPAIAIFCVLILAIIGTDVVKIIGGLITISASVGWVFFCRWLPWTRPFAAFTDKEKPQVSLAAMELALFSALFIGYVVFWNFAECY